MMQPDDLPLTPAEQALLDDWADAYRDYSEQHPVTVDDLTRAAERGRDVREAARRCLVAAQAKADELQREQDARLARGDKALASTARLIARQRKVALGFSDLLDEAEHQREPVIRHPMYD